MIPCPDCKRFQIHALHCPNPDPLPNFEVGPARCPDCGGTVVAHEAYCPMVRTLVCRGRVIEEGAR